MASKSKGPCQIKGIPKSMRGSTHATEILGDHEMHQLIRYDSILADHEMRRTVGPELKLTQMENISIVMRSAGMWLGI
jgi:hypothetical protein